MGVVAKMTQQSGFTLMELIITVAIAAIVLAIGVPSFQEMMRSNRLATQTNELVAAMNLTLCAVPKARSIIINSLGRARVAETSC